MTRMVSVLVLTVLLGGCAATKTQLSPTSRIVLFCNPVGHAVDLALLGVAVGVTVYGGVGWVSGLPHLPGEVSVPGVMCYDAIADRVDAAEAPRQ